jgi:hypothetical protein
MENHTLVPISSVDNGTVVLLPGKSSPEDLTVIEVDGNSVRCEYKSFGRIETCYIPATEQVQVIAS